MGPKLKHKGKLFVFNRMEIFLLLVLMALLAAISFTAGVKMGQKLSYQAAGLAPQDRKAVQLKSWIEEDTHNLQESKDSQDQIEAVIAQDLKNKLEQISRAESPPQQTSAPPPRSRQRRSPPPSKRSATGASGRFAWAATRRWPRPNTLPMDSKCEATAQSSTK